MFTAVMRTRLLYFGALLLIVGIAIFAYLSVGSLIRTAGWVSHTHQAIAYGEDLVKTLVDMETGERGFVITGEESFLEPYYAGEKKFSELLAEAKRHVGDNSVQLKRLLELEEKQDRWDAEVLKAAIDKRRLVAQNAKGSRYLQELVAAGAGKKIMDEIRGVLDELQSQAQAQGDKDSELLVMTLAKDFLDQETGLRGFLVAGKEEFLEPYNAAHAVLDKRLTQLEERLRDSREQQRAVERLRKLESEWAEKIAEPEIAVRREIAQNDAHLEDVGAFIASGVGKQHLDGMRAVLKAFTEAERALLETRDRDANYTAWSAKIILLLGNLLVIGLGLLVVFMLNRQDWLKNGLSMLNEKLRGDQSIEQLSESVVVFLSKYLNAKVGLFYLLRESANPGDYLEAVADYGYSRRQENVRNFRLGEALVGRAALERQIVSVNQSREECPQVVQSGLSTAMPRNVTLIPFLYENSVKGVIELGTPKPVSKLARTFLGQAMQNVGIAVNTAESRAKMQELLEQSQRQAEELQQQTEQLQIQQAQMQQINEELQAQSEELQSQQEELRQTNEELEERTKELERQQGQVQQQNADLEKARAVVQAKAEELALASKYKSEFLANMSHELRTPLNSLLILAQMLADNKKGNLDEKQVEYARTIRSSGADLLTLINDILDLSKVEAGKIEIQPEEVAFSAIVESLEQKFRHVASERGLSFDIRVAGNLPRTIFMDEQRLKQILTNLLGNAFKFTHQGGITVDIGRPEAQADLSRSGLDPAHSVVFSVSDTGIGIPSEKQKVIFEAFQQADGSTSRKYGGTGLGLSISRQLVQLLGGEIQIRSEEDKGSRFMVYLPERLQYHSEQAPSAPRMKSPPGPEAPVAPAPRPAPSAPQPAAADARPAPADDRAQLQPGDKSILVIEDDRNFSRILMDLGREKGFKCLLAEDGKIGLELAEKYQPSAIMLDLGLPLVDGWAVMEKLKDNPQTRHLPVHFVSGADYSIDARKMGAIGYSLKPVSMAELTDAFKKIERFISKTVKNLLIVSDDPRHQQAIQELLKEGDVRASVAAGHEEALAQLQAGQVDCVVLDVALAGDTGVNLLERLPQEYSPDQVPIIVYTERALNDREQVIIQKCTANLTVKEAHSSERLLDEATLFLHQVESKLPQEQQKMLRQARNKEGVLNGKKVLLVDDDMRNVFALTAALEDQGMLVETAVNGREALTALAKHPDTDVVLMDIMMPEMDGYEATRQIRAQQKFNKLPIIALTAKAMRGDKTKCIEAGANDYLSKPIEPERLLSLLRVWLYP